MNLLLILTFFILTGCNNPNIQEGKKWDIVTQDTTILPPHCAATQDIENVLSKIIINPNLYIKNQKDECVLNLLDSLSEKAIKTNDTKYLEVLEAICKVGDGYLSEALMDLSGRQFYENFFTLINFCYAGNKCLRNAIIEALSMEVSTSENPAKKRVEIGKFVREEISKANFNNAKIQYIEQLVKEINPKKFD